MIDGSKKTLHKCQLCFNPRTWKSIMIQTAGVPHFYWFLKQYFREFAKYPKADDERVLDSQGRIGGFCLILLRHMILIKCRFIYII